MKIPDKFPIERIVDYHTHYTGRYKNGNQFFGYVHHTFRRPKNYKGDYENHIKEHILLYIFNQDGNLINYHYYYSGITSEIDLVEQGHQIEKMILNNGPYYYCDIIVKPFSVKLDLYGEEIEFGLIPDFNLGIVTMEPGNTIAFRVPWDGTYDT